MEKIPFLYMMIRGAVGKQFVVKHYRGGRVVVSRFPDMSGVVATRRQRVRRDLFREAVVFAKWVIGDEGRKRTFRKTLPWKKRKNVYQAAVRLYMRMLGDKQWLRKQLAVKSMMESGRAEWPMGSALEQYEQWRVIFRKKEPLIDLAEPEAATTECLTALSRTYICGYG